MGTLESHVSIKGLMKEDEMNNDSSQELIPTESLNTCIKKSGIAQQRLNFAISGVPNRKRACPQRYSEGHVL